MQMEARAPIAGRALRATRDLPDAPQCPPSGGRHSKGRSPGPCAKMEQSYPLHRHRSERAGSRVQQYHTPETVEVHARRTLHGPFEDTRYSKFEISRDPMALPADRAIAEFADSQINLS